ncbi:MAG: RNA-binding protein, partial [Prevotellaceae bacterium]|nr:RNA-binding protein [Prevotellaceae bacterium]
MNIFVSGLSFKATDEDLKKVFSAYGEVSSAK